MKRLLAVGFLAGMGLGGFAAAQTAARESGPPAFRTGTGEVLVDIVVRDRRGRLTRDLKAGEITVLENGVEQKVTSFRQLRAARTGREDGEPAVQVGGSQGDSVEVRRQIRLVSLVFAGLDSDGRRNARNAAQAFVANDIGPNVYYAVFHISRTFHPVLAYTNNHALIKQAIDRVTGWDKVPTSGPAGIASGTAPSGTGAPGPNFEGTIAAMSDFNSRMDLNMFGAVNLFSLWGVITELGKLPGRKSVLYFSQGLALPFDYRQHYLSMVSAANRANVAIYTIDARGLTSGGDMGKVHQNLQQAVNTTNDVTTRAASEGSGMWGGRELGMDRAMQSIYDHLQHNLFDLSEKTGGFLIANTNDFRKPMEQLSEDFNTYYEVTYRPADSSYDGRFRAITVQVGRAGAKVQAREGYFALPPMAGQAVFPYEVPLLHTLGRQVLPKELNYQAAVLQYAVSNGVRQAELVFDMPLNQVTFRKDAKGLKALSYISLLALIKDEQGQVVSKLSRDLPLEHTLDSVALFRRGRLNFMRPVALPPGRYTLESAVSDNAGGKSAAKRSVVMVASGSGGPAMSDLALVRRVDPLPDPVDAQDPLQIASGRVVPTLEDHFRGGAGGQLAVFCLLYPAPTAEPAVVYLDLLRDGKAMHREQPALPEPDGRGAVPLIARLRLDAVQPGEYELRAALVQNGKAATRSMMVTVE